MPRAVAQRCSKWNRRAAERTKKPGDREVPGMTNKKARQP